MSINSTAISGLRAASTQLEFIGNNVANSNTFGFKQSFVNLADSFSQGRSGRQLVNGVEVQSVSQDFSQGGFSLTSRQLDLAVSSGESFLVMRSAANGETSFTRSGRMDVDKDGLIINGNNEVLQAFAITNGVTSATLSDATIPTTPLQATPSTSAAYEINLDANSEVISPATLFDSADPATFNFRTDTVVHDSLGISHSLETYYRKTADNTWDVYVEVDGNSLGVGGAALDNISFTNAGTINAVGGALATATYNPANGSDPLVLDLTFANATQFGSDNQTRRIITDGFASGEVTSINIDEDGVIAARYSNGQLQNLSQVALAEFPAVSGLQQAGNMSFKETNSSGAPVIEAGNSIGGVQSGSLEESNVDLTQELVSLVTTQRFFQSNARVVTASDEITQTILQI